MYRKLVVMSSRLRLDPSRVYATKESHNKLCLPSVTSFEYCVLSGEDCLGWSFSVAISDVYWEVFVRARQISSVYLSYLASFIDSTVRGVI